MKQYLLDPTGPAELKNKIFDSPYRELKRQAKNRGININTYDLGDLKAADMVLCFNYKEEFFQKCQAANIPKQRLALFAFEPRVVLPRQYTKQVWDQYGTIFTHLDDLVDNKRIFKIRQPLAEEPLDKVPGFNERKFLILINANKYSYVTNELYSYRRKAIRFFEKFNDFDLYGYGWEQGNRVIKRHQLIGAIKRGRLLQVLKDLVDIRPYKNYRGSVEDKNKLLRSYKFSLCFENEKNAPGYITEKIFDSLLSGTVPVYLGTPNIEKYVPRNCFIDMRDFKNFSELNTYLRSVSPKEFSRIQAAGQKFIKHGGYKYWNPDKLFKNFLDVLERKTS